jgi:hypothetical protein
MSTSKNLGQVVGVYIGSTAPTNNVLIWYDTNTSEQIHKIYDTSAAAWVALNPKVVTAITYSDLSNTAAANGLSVGKMYKLTDKSNVLALAISSTKVEYTDNNGNIIIDDLGSGKEYHVSSNNLLIDGLKGVFDTTTNKLLFSFTDSDPSSSDYLLGEKNNNSIWNLAKFKISKLISSVTGNSLSWNNGIFFNFSNAISNILDKVGGIVSKNLFDTTIQGINTNINNVGEANQNIINTAQNNLNEATTDVAIYSKQYPDDPDVSGTPGDLKKGDLLSKILLNIQKYINLLKYATGIKISSNYSNATSALQVNSNDTVETAFGKIQYRVNNHDSGDGIKTSLTNFPILTEKPTAITKDDSILTSLSKLSYLVNNIDSDQIKDNIIEQKHIVQAGIFPTDIFRIDLTTTFDFTGSAFGGIATQGASNDFFNTDTTYPYSLYRLYQTSNPEYPRILSFIPVIPVISNITNTYSNANSLIHYQSGAINIQFIFQIPKSTYDNLYGLGRRYFKCSIQLDIYHYQTDQNIVYIPMGYINIVNVNLIKSIVSVGDWQHIILKVTVESSATNS